MSSFALQQTCQIHTSNANTPSSAASNCYVSIIYPRAHWSNGAKPSFKSLCKILGRTFFSGVFMLKFQLSCDSFSLWVCWLSISRFHEWVYCLLSIRSVNSSSKGHLFINACFTQRMFVECIMTWASPGAHSLRLKLKLDRLREDGPLPPLHLCYCINADRDRQTTVSRDSFECYRQANYFWLLDHQVYYSTHLSRVWFSIYIYISIFVSSQLEI